MKRMKNRLCAGVFVALSVCLASCTEQRSDVGYDIVLAGGRVIDPASGLDAVRNLGIRDGQIDAISVEPLIGEREINVAGLVVAPGFIDLHQHGQSEEAYALSVQDGVTSSFELEVGTDDVNRWYAERAPGQIINYGVSIGHIPVRMVVMGDEGDFLPSGPGASESATDFQIIEMARRIEAGLSQGAVAIGFGTAYTPAASVTEIETMFELCKEHNASAHVHARAPLGGSVDGLKEVTQMARRTGASVHIVHANSTGGEVTEQFLALIAEARDEGLDITTEAYPYGAGMTRIESALFDDWGTWTDERFNDFQWVETGERLTRPQFARYREQGGEIIIHGRTEAMTRSAITNPLTMVASDGYIVNGRGHPRSSGTYAKVLGKYARENGDLTLMDALRKMTIEPAQRLARRVPAMRDKGRIQIGADADITVFDPATVIDRSTYIDPTAPSAGIRFVLVHGVVVVGDGELVPQVRPGRPVRAERT